MKYKQLFTLCCFFLLRQLGSAADYYWVGGTGNWSDVANHWATSSGGTVFHTQLPTPNDNVYFDLNSFLTIDDTVYTTGGASVNHYCKNFDWSGATNNPVFQQESVLNISGSFTLAAGMKFNGYVVDFESLTTGNTINTNAVVIEPNYAAAHDLEITFYNVPAEWSLQSDFLLNSVDTLLTVIKLDGGTFNSNGYTIECSEFKIYDTGFVTFNLSTSTLNLKSSFFVIDYAFSGGGIALNVDSSIINIGLSGTAGLFYSETGVYNLVQAHSIDPTMGCRIKHAITRFCSFNFLASIDFLELKPINANTVGFPAILWGKSSATGLGKCIIDSDAKIFFYDTLRIDTLVLTSQVDSVILSTGANFNITSQFIVNSSVSNKVLINSSTAGVSKILDFGSQNVCIDNVILQDVDALGTGAHFAGTNSIDLGNNTGWIFNQCNTFGDVWPGDANYDLTANNLDVLNIGLAYNETGPLRAAASLNWVAQPATDWGITFQNLLDKKHADTNGDGTVNSDDTTAVSLNYGLIHPARIANNSTINSGIPFYLEANVDSANLSDTIYVDFMLGTSSFPVDSIYGIAFSLNYDTTLVDTTGFTHDFTNCWLGLAGNDLLTYTHPRYLQGAIDYALVRTDLTNTNGFGPIGRTGVVIVDNVGARMSLPLTISGVKAITASEYELLINVNGDSVSVDTSSTGLPLLYPGPNQISIGNSKNYIAIHSGDNNIKKVEMINTMGETILTQSINANDCHIPSFSVAQGIYVLKITTTHRTVNRKIFIQH